jgi:hypothetical protein
MVSMVVVVVVAIVAELVVEVWAVIHVTVIVS